MRPILGCLAAVAAVLFAAPPAASAPRDALLDYRDIPEPMRVVVEMESDLLSYDICWSDDVDAARAALVERILEQAPVGGLFVVELPQLPDRWRPVTPRSMTALDGQPMDRRRIARGMRTYEEDLESALLDVFERVKEQRPDAMLAIQGFAPRATRNGQLYESLVDSFDYVLVEDDFERRFRRYERRRDMAWKIEREIDWLEDFGWDQSKPIVLRYDKKWVFAGYGELPGEEAIAIQMEDAAPEELEEANSHTDQLTTNTSPAPAPIEQPDFAPIPTDRVATGGGGNLAPVPTTSQTRVLPAGSMRYDLNLDGAINQADTSLVLGAWGTADPNADFDGSGKVDSGDLALVLGAYTSNQQNEEPGPEPETPPSTSAFAVLEPGGGFNSPVTQPARVGPSSHPAHDATAIARWNVVPRQEFDGRLEIGVVAFHAAGIDHVSFSVENGPVAKVHEMEFNPRTGTNEYVVTLDAAEFETGEEGLIEVRAVAYPTDGFPRALEPLELYVDKGGLKHLYAWVDPVNGDDATGVVYETDSPSGAIKAFKTPQGASHGIAWTPGQNYLADGGVIFLMAGDHQWGGSTWPNRADTRDRWLVMKPAEGVSREQVRFTHGSGSPRTKMLKMENVTFDGAVVVIGVNTSTGKPMFWADNIVFKGTGRDDPRPPIDPGVESVYVTNSEITRTMNALMGFKKGFSRNVYIHGIGGDAFQNQQMVINCRVEDLDGSSNATHSDLMQYVGDGIDNVIVYGLDATTGIEGQVFITRNFNGNFAMTNFAMVNCMVVSDNFGGQWLQDADHLVFENNAWLCHNFAFADDPRAVRGEDPSLTTDLKNFSLKNNVFRQLRIPATGNDAFSEPTNVIVDNHSIIGEPVGESATTGPFIGPLPFDSNYEVVSNNPMRLVYSSDE